MACRARGWVNNPGISKIPGLLTHPEGHTVHRERIRDMTETQITPERLAEAVTRLASTLQGMLSPEEWAELRELARAIQDATDDRVQRLAGIELVDWLAAHPDLRERVHLELNLLGDLRGELQAALSEQARSLGLPEDNLDLYVEAILRGVQPEMAPGDGETARQVFATPDKAILVSLRNLWLRPGELLEFLAGAAFTAKDVRGDPNGILLGFGALWLVRSLYKLATEEVRGEDAAVLWGVWHACGRTGGEASLRRIVEEANKAAQQAHLPALADQTVKRSLHNLTKLGIVEPLNGERWRLREKCRDHPLG